MMLHRHMQTRLYISYCSSDGYRLSSVGGGASLRLECKLNYKDVSRTSDEYWIHCKIDMMSCQQMYLVYTISRLGSLGILCDEADREALSCNLYIGNLTITGKLNELEDFILSKLF